MLLFRLSSVWDTFSAEEEDLGLKKRIFHLGGRVNRKEQIQPINFKMDIMFSCGWGIGDDCDGRIPALQWKQNIDSISLVTHTNRHTLMI
mmetsp:Transcript_21396/g.32727  ORF Transcript_21396/g.32727 Transcript_21396/m.32727 type:complete len:90 (+) Transcript_21396:1171-1440(+)